MTWVGARRLRFELIRVKLSRPRLDHLTAARVAGAEKKNFQAR
jgi:hypothetical protein